MEMITVHVRFTGGLTELAGLTEEEWEIPKGISIAQLIEGFKDGYGEQLYNFIKTPNKYMTVTLNGREANRRGGWNAALNEGDHITFLVPHGKMVMLKDVGGGSAF